MKSSNNKTHHFLFSRKKRNLFLFVVLRKKNVIIYFFIQIRFSRKTGNAEDQKVEVIRLWKCKYMMCYACTVFMIIISKTVCHVPGLFCHATASSQILSTPCHPRAIEIYILLQQNGVENEPFLKCLFLPHIHHRSFVYTSSPSLSLLCLSGYICACICVLSIFPYQSLIYCPTHSLQYFFFQPLHSAPQRRTISQLFLHKHIFFSFLSFSLVCLSVCVSEFSFFHNE